MQPRIMTPPPAIAQVSVDPELTISCPHSPAGNANDDAEFFGLRKRLVQGRKVRVSGFGF